MTLVRWPRYPVPDCYQIHFFVFSLFTFVEETNLVEYWKKIEEHKKDEITKKKIRCRFEGVSQTNGIITSIPSSSGHNPEVRVDTASIEGETTDEGETGRSSEDHERTPQKKKNIFKRAISKASKAVHSSSTPDHEPPEHVSPPFIISSVFISLFAIIRAFLKNFLSTIS